MVCVLLILSSPLSKRIFIVSILLADYANKWFNNLNHSKPIFIKSELGFLVKYKGFGLKVILVYVLGLKSGVWDWCVGCSVKVFVATSGTSFSIPQEGTWRSGYQKTVAPCIKMNCIRIKIHCNKCLKICCCSVGRADKMYQIQSTITCFGSKINEVSLGHGHP